MFVLDELGDVPSFWIFAGLLCFALVLFLVQVRRARPAVSLAPKTPRVWKVRAAVVQVLAVACVAGALVGTGLGLSSTPVQRDAFDATSRACAAVVVIDYSGSLDSYQHLIDAALARITPQASHAPVGYVIFSDRTLAFTPVVGPDRFREVFGMTRMLVRNSQLIRGGTHIFAGLVSGAQMLEAQCRNNAPLILISDLNDPQNQWRQYLVHLVSEGRLVKVIAVHSSVSDVARLEAETKNRVQIQQVTNPGDAELISIALEGQEEKVFVRPFSLASGPNLNALLAAALILSGMLACTVFPAVQWSGRGGVR